MNIIARVFRAIFIITLNPFTKEERFSLLTQKERKEIARCEAETLLKDELRTMKDELRALKSASGESDSPADDDKHSPGL